MLDAVRDLQPPRHSPAWSCRERGGLSLSSRRAGAVQTLPKMLLIYVQRWPGDRQRSNPPTTQSC